MRFLAVSLMLVSAAGTALADCAPEKMVRIVFRDATPGLDPQSFAAKPMMLYRLGSHYARTEEEPDPEAGIHGLIVTNQRDTWMVNLADKTGRHIVDTAESYDVRAPIVGGPRSPFVRFEFGCEVEYMEGEGIEPASAQVGEQKLLRYEQSIDDLAVMLLVTADGHVPDSVAVVEDGELVYLLRYVEYETGLEPDLSLFEKPGGIAYVEAEPDGESEVSTLESVGERMTWFYVSPSEVGFEAVQRGIRAHLDGFTARSDLAMLAAVFLARVHAAHGWPLIDLGELDEQARSIAAQDDGEISRYVHDDARVDPSKLDVWWISFFATGETGYLDRIIERVGDLDAQTETADILVTGAANWSLSSNCRQHPAVLGHVQSLLERDPPLANRQTIVEIVTEIEAEEDPSAR